MVGTITGRQKGKAKERSEDEQPARTKKGRKLDPLMIGHSLTHDPFNVTWMQDLIVMRGLEQASPINVIFLFVAKVEAH